MSFGSRLLAVAILIVVAGTASANERDLIREADLRFSSGSYQPAIDRYEELVEEYPQSVHVRTARFRIAQSYFFLNEFERARDRFLAFTARFPGSRAEFAVDLWLGLAHYRVGQYEEADGVLSRYLDISDQPESLRGRAHLYRALTALGRADYETSRSAIQTDLRRAIAIADDAEGRYAVTTLLSLLTRDGDDAAIIGVWDESASGYEPESPNQELRLRYVADAAYRLGRIDLAVTLYERLSDYSIDSAQWALQRLYRLAGEDDGRRRELFRRAEQRLSSQPARLRTFWFSVGAEALAGRSFELAELYLYRVWELRNEGAIPAETIPALAEAIRRLGRAEEAIAILETARSEGETDHGRDKLLAEILIEEGRANEARSVLATIDSDEPRFLYLNAYAAYVDDDPKAALELIDRPEVLPIVRTDAALLALLARLRLASGNAESAVRAYRELFTNFSVDGAVHREFLRALLAARQFNALEQEIARGSGDPEELRYFGGLAAFHRQDFPRAVELLDAVAEARWEPSRSYHLAWSLYRMGQIDEARDAIAPVVDQLPDDLRAPGLYLYGWTLYLGGSNQAAATVIQQGIASRPDLSLEKDLRSVLATVYLSLDLVEEALAQYAEVRNLAATDTEQAAAWRTYAEVLAVAGRAEQAIVEYDLLARRFRQEDAGRLALLDAALLLDRAERYEEARDRYREFRARHPAAPETDRALYGAGHASYRLGETARSLLWWEPLIDEFPDSRYTPDAMFVLAGIYEERGERREALELYARLSAVYQDHPLVAEAERQRRRIRLELDGLTSEEAELWVALEQNGGPEPGSDRWFDIVIGLGRIAVRERFSLTMQQRGILDYLVEAGSFDGPEAAEATLLLAEYYRRQGEYRRAIDEYAAVAGMVGATPEMRAQSLYEFAVIAGELGEEATMLRAVEELEREFPDAVWTERAAARLRELR